MWNPFRRTRSPEDTSLTVEGWAGKVLNTTSHEEFEIFLQQPALERVNRMVHDARAIIDALDDIFVPLEKQLPAPQVIAATMAVGNFDEQMNEAEPFMRLLDAHDIVPNANISVAAVVAHIVHNRNRAHALIAKIRALQDFPDQTAERINLLKKRYSNADIAQIIAKNLSIDKNK